MQALTKTTCAESVQTGKKTKNRTIHITCLWRMKTRPAQVDRLPAPCQNSSCTCAGFPIRGSSTISFTCLFLGPCIEPRIFVLSQLALRRTADSANPRRLSDQWDWIRSLHYRINLQAILVEMVKSCAVTSNCYACDMIL